MYRMNRIRNNGTSYDDSLGSLAWCIRQDTESTDRWQAVQLAEKRLTIGHAGGFLSVRLAVQHVELLQDLDRLLVWNSEEWCTTEPLKRT